MNLKSWLSNQPEDEGERKTLRAASEWRLTPEEAEQLVGEIGHQWTPRQTHTADLVNSIYLNLRYMPPVMARAWPKTPNDNSLFVGRAPLELMLNGTEGLERVLRFIKGQNGGSL